MAISKPDVNISLVAADIVLGIGARRDLIVCQTPNASANALVIDIPDKTQTELDSLLGAGSYSRVMIQKWLDANGTDNNVRSELDMITLKEGTSATASDIVLTFTGTSATEAGTIELSILSSDLYKKTISVAIGDDPTDVALAITTAYVATVAPFSVGNASGVVTITASDAGTIGDGYGIEITGTPAGLTAAVTAATGGAVPPTVDDIMDLVGNRRYQGILWPSDLITSISEVTDDFLDVRFNTSNDILDGVAFVGNSGTLAALKVIVNAENSQSLVVMGNSVTVGGTTKDGPEIVHPVDWTVAEFMAIRARRLTEGASIASVVTNNASGDQFGGISLASLPYFNTLMSDTPVTTSVSLFTGAEQAELNIAGFSVVGPNRPLTETIMGTVVTTYKLDTKGNSNVSFKYLNYVDTASVCREFLYNNFKSLFAQSRLTDGDLLAGRSMENASSIKAAFKGLLAILKDDALVRKGRVADRLIDENLTVVLDLANRKATINSVLPIVTQLETINMPLQLTFEL